MSGTIEFVEDDTLSKRLFEERAWLNKVMKAYPNEKVRIFKIATGEAVFPDMSCNCREKEQPRYIF